MLRKNPLGGFWYTQRGKFLHHYPLVHGMRQCYTRNQSIDILTVVEQVKSTVIEP